MASVRAVVITNKGSDDQDPGSEIKETGRTRLQCKILEKIIRLLTIPPHQIVVIDVSNNPEHQFWVATQTSSAYPMYPQVYIGDRRIGSLSDLEANEQKIASLAAKNAESTVHLAGGESVSAGTNKKGLPTASAMTPFQELGVIRKWCTAKELRDLLASVDEEPVQPKKESVLASKSCSALEERRFGRRKRLGGNDSGDGECERIGSMLLTSDEFSQVVVGLPAPLLSQVVFASVVQGRVDVIKKMLSSGVSFAGITGDDDGWNPLEVACINGSLDVVDVLVELPYTKVSCFQLIQKICVVCNSAYDAVVQKLFAAKKLCVEAEAPDKKTGQTVFHAICHAQNVSFLRMFIDYLAGAVAPSRMRAILDTVDKSRGKAALHIAASNGDSEMVGLLLDAGASPNITEYTPRKRTPLHFACVSAVPSVISLLLKAGASPDWPAGDGQLPLHTAVAVGFVPAVRALLEGASLALDALDKNGSTPLHIAASRGYAEVIACLSATGKPICVDKDDALGHTALQIASKKGFCDVVDALINAGADVNITDIVGSTPLYIAASKGFGSIVSRLIAAGAGVNLCDKNGRTPLHAAALQGHTDIVAQLLAAKADPNIADVTETAPVSAAAQEGYFDVVKLLLEAGVSPDPKDSGNWTPLQWARQQRHYSIVGLLIENGADPTAALPGGSLGAVGSLVDSLSFICSFSSPFVVNSLCDAMIKRKEIMKKSSVGNPQQQQLQSIDLSGREITFLPRTLLSLVHRVTEINVENNLLTSIPAELSTVKEMRIKGNPFDAIPKASVWGWSRMRSALQSLSARAGAWWEFRTFVLGPTGSGKTTLLHCLNGRHVAGKDSCKKYVPTKGVAEYRDYFEDFKRDKTNCVCNVFCVSGETSVQAKVVSLMMQPQASGAAFVICCNIADPTKFCEIDMLMDVITSAAAAAAASPPVVLVLTHTDACSADVSKARVEEFKAKYAPKASVVCVSCKDGTGVSELRGLILGPSVGTRFGTRSTAIPERWVMLYDIVQRNQSRVCVEWAEFALWGIQCGISTEDGELEEAAAFLAGAGLVLYKDASEVGRHVLLSPQWLGSVVSEIASIRFTHSPLLTSSVTLIAVGESDNRVLSSPTLAGSSVGRVTLPGPPVPNLSAIMEEFCVWYRVTLGAKDYVLVPMLLPPELSLAQRRKLAELWAPQVRYPVIEQRRAIKFPLFPEGLAEQLVVRVLRIKGVVPDLVWGRGALFHTERESALVLFDPAGQSATCTARYSFTTEAALVDGVRIHTAPTLLRDILAAIASHLRYACPSVCSGLQHIPICSHCIQKHPVHVDPLGFTLAQCEASPLLQCPADKKVVVVHSCCVAPDIELPPSQVPEDKIVNAVLVEVSYFGTVLKALYKSAGGDKDVRVLATLLRSNDPSVVKSFTRRVSVVSAISHQCIAKLIGTIASSSPSPFVKLVYEHENLQTLHSFILKACNSNNNNNNSSSNSTKGLPMVEALRLASEVSEAMRYLHESVFPPIVHGGLSSFSVLVTPDAHVKVADVGLRGFFSTLPGHEDGEDWRWEAPDPPPSHLPNDVYSFAMLLWELVSPPTLPFEDHLVKNSFASLRVAIAEGLRPDIPAYVPLPVKELIQACWAPTPSARPTFGVICPYLEHCLKEAAAVVTGASKATTAFTRPLLSLTPVRKEFFSPVTSTDTLKEDEDPPATLSQSLKLRSSYKSFSVVEPAGILLFSSDGSVTASDSRGSETKRIVYTGNAGVTASSEVAGCALVARSDGTLTVYAKATYAQTTSVLTPGVVTALYSSGDSKYVWGGTHSGTLVLWSVSALPGALKEEEVLTVHDGCSGKPVTAIVRHGQMVVASIGDTLYSFSLGTAEPLFVWPAHVGGVTAVVSAPPNVWSGTSSGEVWMWTLPPATPASQEEFIAGIKCTHNRVFYGSVNKLVAVPSARQVWSISADRVIIWDAALACPLQSLILPPSIMRNLYVVPFLMTESDLDCGDGNGGGGGSKTSRSVGRSTANRQAAVVDANVVGKTVWVLCENNFFYIWKTPEK